MAPKGERIQAAELEWLRLASQVGPVETIPKAQEVNARSKVWLDPFLKKGN